MVKLTCSIPGCTTKSLPDTSFFRIPKECSPIREGWIEFIRSCRNDPNWEPGSNSALCSHHFNPNTYSKTGNRRTLSRGSVPTIRGSVAECIKTVCTTDGTAQTSRGTASTIGTGSKYGSITYHKEVVDQTSISVAAFLLYRMSIFCKPLKITLGIDEDSSDCICFADPSPAFKPIPSSPVSTPSIRNRRRQCNSIRSPAAKRKLPMHEEPDLQETPTRKRVKMDHPYFFKTTPRTRARELTNKLIQMQKTLKITKCQSQRRKCRVTSLRLLLRNMRTRLGEETANTISDSYSSILKELIRSDSLRRKKNNTGIRYSETIKKFAVTLHFYSPRAYQFLRNHMTLPHESTISSWTSSTDCGPGFNKAIIERLGQARTSAVNRCMDDTVIQLDEKSIKKDTPWNPKKHKYVGFIDYGPECDLVDPPLASNALVVLLAGLTGGWKVPIGYIFTNKVSGLVQQNLVTSAVRLMSEQKFLIHAVVSDGTSSNVSMFKGFGVSEKIGALKCTFDQISDVSQEINAIYDVVHMMKLWRNMLHQYKVIFWREKPIRWLYFEYLEQLQGHELIRAANKLSPQHIHFENNRMKVRLAVQVFSRSVADAIDFCREDLKLNQFKGSEETTSFIRLLDSAFDILNSRHPKQRGHKAPIKASNIVEKKSFLLHVCEEFENLTTGTRTSKKVVKRCLVSLFGNQIVNAVCLGSLLPKKYYTELIIH